MLQATSKTSPDPTVSFGLAEQLFGDDFEVWAFEHHWHRIKTMGKRWETLSVDLYVELINRLSETARSGRVCFYELDQDNSLCLVPLSENDGFCVALSIVARNSDCILDLAQRAASAAVVQRDYGQRVQEQLRESDSQLAVYSSRIHRGEGELAWLHGLAGNAALTIDDNKPRKVAERILPQMGRLINARTVAFVPYPEQDAPENSPLDIWQCGDTFVPDHVCLSLIKTNGNSLTAAAATRRYNAPVWRSDEFAGVLTCIVKPVVSDSRQVGWILAINKDLQFLSDDDLYAEIETPVDELCAFGQFESSLVEAAAKAISAHDRNCRLIAEKQALVDGTIRSLVNAIDAKDSYTCGHSDRVAVYAQTIAAAMGLDQEFCDRIHMTGLVHDVGKIGVPDNVLQKPGKLTDAEFDRIKEHPVTGHAILEHLKDFSYVLPGVLYHHEAVDGSGYPSGLKGDRIPLQARILAVADAYDAMTSDRPYRRGMPTAKAEAIIADGAGKQWDADCVAAFQSCIESIRRVTHDRHVPLIRKPNIKF